MILPGINTGFYGISFLYFVQFMKYFLILMIENNKANTTSKI